MIRSLEGLRGVAALFVALFHLALWNGVPLIRQGYLFVDLFFVLSGFVISSAYAERMKTGAQVGSFLIRRFGRLFPLLVVATTLFVLAKNLNPLVKRQLIEFGYAAALKNPEALAFEWPTAWELLTTATFTHARGTNDRNILNFVSWSISVEFWAYVLFALLVVVVAPARRGLVFLAVSAAGLAVTLWASIGKHACIDSGSCLHLVYDFAFARCVLSFFLGALVWRVRSLGRRMEVPVQLAALAALLALFSLVGTVRWLAFVFPLVFGVLIWSISADRGPVARALCGRAGLKLGQWSYSIYMLHPVLLVLAFFQAAQRFNSPLLAPAVIAAYVGVLLACAWASYRYLEDPARRFFNGVADRVASGAPAAVKGRLA